MFVEMLEVWDFEGQDCDEYNYLNYIASLGKWSIFDKVKLVFHFMEICWNWLK